MIDERFNKLIPIILHNEGGYCNTEGDTGGETNYGISQRAYPDLNIKELTIEQASEIYFKDYYTPLNLQLIQLDELALHIFDMADNAGKKTAVILLQQVLHVPLQKQQLVATTTTALMWRWSYYYKY